MHFYRYAKFIVGYPYANIIIICILVIWAAVIGFIPQLGAQKLPNFSEPTKVALSCLKIAGIL